MTMLLYRYAKLMEESGLRDSLPRDPGAAETSWLELLQMKQRMEVELAGMLGEDCSDWAAEATY